MISGIAKVEVAPGNAVPAVSPAVGTAPSLFEIFHAQLVSPSVVPDTGAGVAIVGMVKNVSVCGINVKFGTGSSNTGGVQITVTTMVPPAAAPLKLPPRGIVEPGSVPGRVPDDGRVPPTDVTSLKTTLTLSDPVTRLERSTKPPALAPVVSTTGRSTSNACDPEVFRNLSRVMLASSLLVKTIEPVNTMSWPNR